MTVRRTVRVTPDFFAALDAQLPTERGTGPSRNDFAAFELLEIVELFATRWDDLPPMYLGPGTYRVLIQAGHVVAFVSVIGRLAGDGAIELIDVDLDVIGPDVGDDPTD